MSGIGKTFWATRLAAIGFECFHCDDMIASQLRNEADKPMVNIYDMGNWIGFPYEEGFYEKENRYVELESKVLISIAHSLHLPLFDSKNVVVDMTGSAIYAGEDVFTKLRRSLVLVYLALTPEVHHQMLQEYIRHPRPLIWQGLFNKSPSETNEVALRDSYSRLIAYREKWYEKFCDVKIEYSTHRQDGLAVESFVQVIHAAAQHSVQRTAGSLRDLQAFSTPRKNPALKQSPNPPSRS